MRYSAGVCALNISNLAFLTVGLQSPQAHFSTCMLEPFLLPPPSAEQIHVVSDSRE
jgi:hypothetical protein